MNEEKHIIESYKVPIIENAERLSDFTPGIFETITSRKGMKNAIKKGLVRIDGKIGYTADYIKGGETIDLYKDNNWQNKPEIDLDLDVLFEDEYLAIVNKPAGIVVSGNKKWTLENALPLCLNSGKKEDSLHRPEPIHRLDYPTSGVLLVGKTVKSVMLLNRMFEERDISKIYYTVTIKAMKEQGIINSEIDNKPAKTRYTVVEKVISAKYEFLNLVKLNLFTGRKHQLRRHLSYLGNPILGDLVYGEEGFILKGKGLYLHAAILKFTHPFTKEKLEVTAPFPKKFEKLFPKATTNSLV